MNFKLTRIEGNRTATKGMLTVPTTNFAAYTLEAQDPEYARIRTKSLLALPDGIYRLKLFYGKTGYSLRFSMSGAYHLARFEEGNEPADVASGSIILGVEFDGESCIKGSKDTMKMFGSFLELLLSQQRFGKKNEDITLTIQHAPDYVYNDITEPVEDAFDVGADNWNVIADNPDVEPSNNDSL